MTEIHVFFRAVKAQVGQQDLHLTDVFLWNCCSMTETQCN